MEARRDLESFITILPMRFGHAHCGFNELPLLQKKEKKKNRLFLNLATQKVLINNSQHKDVVREPKIRLIYPKNILI